MAWRIPRSTDDVFRRGDQGIGVWSLQRTLNVFLTDIAADGDFGAQTERTVREFQASARLEADGIAGPATQRALAMRVVRRSEDGQPTGLIRGFAEMEGGLLLAPVNWTVPGGVDCGLFQRRVYDEDYDNDAVIQRAFDTAYQGRLLADRLIELRGIFVARAGTTDNYGGMGAREKAWRLAALNHNYPSAADRLSRTPIRELSPYWTTAQSWVTTHGFRFPNGSPVRTPLEWTHFYAGTLAGAHGHRGNVTRYVTDWP